MRPPTIRYQPEFIRQMREPLSEEEGWPTTSRTAWVDHVLKPVFDAGGIDYRYRILAHKQMPDDDDELPYLIVNTAAHRAVKDAHAWYMEHVLGRFIESNSPGFDGPVHWHWEAIWKTGDSTAYRELMLRLLGLEPWDEDRVDILVAELVLLYGHYLEVGELAEPPR